ncbi:beta-galactosidase [uncultured Victivallis sp.]|uniref:beta-galactosidase n=1 Tax=uncultured Victivallis sp. TaxID=354118 RepID=UPI002589C31A|nr:beta-galactosidase [uncultured Victivallis sp.]
MDFKRTLGMAFAAVGFSLAAAPAVTDNPYGVCAHVSRGELDIAPQEFKRMHEADINWVRTDFDWHGVEPKQGAWDFSRLDKLIPLAKQANVSILPILDYDVPWATPAWRHPDAWGGYVRRIVSRYAKDLRYWEVWNEQNGSGFWRDRPSGANYVPLLKRAYEEIKKIDPELTVLYGGTAGVPLGYIEDSLKAGAGAYFDVMNIHPYHWQGVPELMIAEFRDLGALMKKYGVGDKPLWITEVGWSTALPPVFYREVLPAAFRRAGIDPAKTTAAAVCDMEKGFSGAARLNRSGNLAMFRQVDEIGLDRLRGLSVERYPVLVPTGGEEFPAEYIPALVDYVKRGGTLLLPSGLPFYYDLRSDGGKVQVNDKYLKQFHIGWDAWWTKEGVPEKESYQKPAPEFDGAFKIDFKPAARFLHDRNLRPGDEFIPIIEAGTDTYKGAVAALYKLDSDLKGNIIVCTTLAVSETVPESQQAEMLPRTYLIALASGVERIFWYNFRSGEWQPDEREAHFGIVRKNLEPKPSFRAYRTLSRLCPSGSTVPVLTRSGETYLAGWTRPDGMKVWAVWTSLRPEKIRLDVRGNVVEALNHLGEKQPVPGSGYAASPAILYLVGPESVSAEPL